MDSMTKNLLAHGMLHTSGLVTATPNQSQWSTTITAYPQPASFSITNELVHSAVDEKALIGYVARAFAQGIAKTVEAQILKAHEMSAQQAMKAIYDAKAKYMQSQQYMLWGDPKKDPIFGLPQVEVSTPSPYLWNDPQTDVLQNIKNYINKVEDYEAKKHDQYKTWIVGDSNSGLFAMDPSSLGEWVDESCESPEPPKQDQAYRNSVTAIFHDLIPGFAQMKQACPVQECTKYKGDYIFLQQTIIHLNDHHKWKREEIADWLETLDHDLTFNTPEEVK